LQVAFNLLSILERRLVIQRQTILSLMIPFPMIPIYHVPGESVVSDL